LLSRYLGQIAVQNNKISKLAGFESSLPLLSKFSICRADCIGSQHLGDSQVLFRIIGFRTSLILAGEGCVDATERSDRLDRIVCAEGENHAVIEKGFPCI